jgi:hypothetical protein
MLLMKKSQRNPFLRDTFFPEEEVQILYHESQLSYHKTLTRQWRSY